MHIVLYATNETAKIIVLCLYIALLHDFFFSLGAQPRGGSRITIRGVLLVQMRAKRARIFETTPTFPKTRPFFVHIRQSDRATTATGQRSSNLCQGK